MKKLLASPYVGWSGILSGVVDLIGFVFLILFFVLEAPRVVQSGVPSTPDLFATLSDGSLIFVALFMIPVALALHRMEQSRVPTLSWIALVVGMIGILATATVQALYVFPRLIQTGQESMLLSYALGLIGLWMLLVSVLGRASAASLPRGLAWLGIVVGVSIILLPVTYIVAGGSAFVANPSSSLSNPLAILGFAVGWLGISIGYAIWAILLGRLFLVGKLPILGS